MKRVFTLLILFAVWAVLMLAAILTLYHVADDPARAVSIRHAGRWYTQECAR